MAKKRPSPVALPPGWRAALLRPGRKEPGRCSVCASPLPPGQKKFCSTRCKDFWYGGWPAARRIVFEREGGRCELCGMDVGLLGRIARRAGPAAAAALGEAFPLPGNRSLEYTWDVHHRRPLMGDRTPVQTEDLQLL